MPSLSDTTPDGFRVTMHAPGNEPLDLTRFLSDASWSSSVPGGFGDATLTIPRMLTQKERGLLGLVTIEHEGRVLFEGGIEDAFAKGSQNSIETDLQAFGLQRILSECSIRRAWSLRSNISPTASPIAVGSNSTTALALNSGFTYFFGRYDTSQPSKYGFRIASAVGASFTAGNAGQVGITLPAGITGARIMFDAVIESTGANWVLDVHSTADQITYTRNLEQPSAAGITPFQISAPLVNGATEIRISGSAIGATGGGATQTYIEVSNIRVLCTAVQEDAGGGFYGGTILRDLLSFTPGLYPGTIEDGSDYVMSEVQAVTRISALDMVQMIEPLYAREWAVWEGGRFDWITPDLKTSGWVVPLSMATEWEIQQSVDAIHKRTYVTFTDAADNLAKEAFVESAIARNPYVRIGRQKDGIIAAPVPMTSVTAPLAAAKFNNDFGRWPDISGTITLPGEAIVSAATGGRQVPAYAIRAGDNITIPELPVEDIYAAGQDGQSVFHVTDVAASATGNTQLSIEGLTRRADVLIARLAAISS